MASSLDRRYESPARNVRPSSLKLLAVLLTALATSLSPREAGAASHVGMELGAEVGYGASPNGAAVNPLGLGVGGRLGITVYGLYLGAEAINYFGSGDGNGGQYRAIQFGGQLGYGFKIRSLTIRPQVGGGDVYLTGSVAGLTSPALPTALCVYVEPSLALIGSIGAFFVGADAGALVLLSEPSWSQSNILTSSLALAFTAHGQIGLKF
jgi:hypothetical protein